MKKIRLYLMFVILSAAGFSAQAQGRHHDRIDKIESARTAYLTQKMNLTADQAQKFWPLYNEFDAKRRDVKKQSRVFKGGNLENLTDAQLKEGINTMFSIRQKELDLEKDYAEKFQKVISIRQLATMYKGEREFTKVLLQKLNQRQQNDD